MTVAVPRVGTTASFKVEAAGGASARCCIDPGADMAGVGSASDCVTALRGGVGAAEAVRSGTSKPTSARALTFCAPSKASARKE